ncbi:UNKNOWN [Stylonychia lemnae]|uniref:Uncharacterized protein n=1 Tax=Stylonychia lemnae TaxID=5949 RepID=A0A078AUQ5_STYLE|nr:UNKNOWN [Stylonychia lemnae]|eukprot:CDW85746.1 UNKNOWN [Stylonychia lemnae]
MPSKDHDQHVEEAKQQARSDPVQDGQQLPESDLRLQHDPLNEINDDPRHPKDKKHKVNQDLKFIKESKVGLDSKKVQEKAVRIKIEDDPMQQFQQQPRQSQKQNQSSSRQGQPHPHAQHHPHHHQQVQVQPPLSKQTEPAGSSLKSRSS